MLSTGGSSRQQERERCCADTDQGVCSVDATQGVGSAGTAQGVGSADTAQGAGSADTVHGFGDTNIAQGVVKLPAKCILCVTNYHRTVSELTVIHFVILLPITQMKKRFANKAFAVEAAVLFTRPGLLRHLAFPEFLPQEKNHHLQIVL